MKKLIPLFLLILVACKVEINGSEESIELIGKTIEYRYGSDIYHVTIDSNNELHWEGLQGEDKGVVYEETYVSEWLDDGKLFISWEEANGIAVSQILDFEAGIVHNHLMNERDASSGLGEIRILD